jgi:signal transduction histidine kinase
VSGRPRDRHRGGYGLGLAISRSVMEDHAGKLSFENRAERGTRFIARFPRKAAA